MCLFLQWPPHYIFRKEAFMLIKLLLFPERKDTKYLDTDPAKPQCKRVTSVKPVRLAGLVWFRLCLCVFLDCSHKDYDNNLNGWKIKFVEKGKRKLENYFISTNFKCKMKIYFSFEETVWIFNRWCNNSCGQRSNSNFRNSISQKQLVSILGSVG